MRTTLLALLALSACQPATIDTVQPGAVHKDALDGEWFWRRTVADVPYGTAATFVGASDAMERLRWNIEEDYLLGYRSYPNVDDAGVSGLEEDGFYGSPLMVFRVEKHFDIRRSYDRTTGEEGNVIQENTESAWYDREYMRIDWSSNLAEVGWSMAGLDARVLGYATGDDRAATAPQFDDTDGDGTIDSLMLEQRVLLEPNTTFLPGYGDVPVCLFYGQAQHECASTEVGVVSSFVKVGARAPFEGLAYDDRWMETFGYFSTERMAYDRAYGLVQPNITRFANRHPLYESSFAVDSRGDVMCESDGDQAPCSTFDAADDPTPVLLDAREREVRPIVYHAGPDFPEDLKAAMTLVAEDWNAPLADAVNGQRYWACMEDGGRKKGCNEEKIDDLQMFVFCPNNPSMPSDPEVCSTDHTGPFGRPDGTADLVRVGDLRYHLVHIVNDAQISSPFGYGPSAADPVGTTVSLADGDISLGAGEIVSGTAFVYGHVLDLVSHQVADLVQLINGEIDPDGFVAGENVEAWVEALRTGDTKGFVGSQEGAPDVWSEHAVGQRLNQISNGLAPGLKSHLQGGARPTDPASFELFMESGGDALQRSGITGAGQAEALAAFEGMVASPFNDLMWSDEAIGAFGYDPASASAASLAGRSPLELAEPARLAEQEAGLVLAGLHAVDLDDGAYSDAALLGLARHYATQGMTYDEIVADVRAQTFREVMLHEIGHTLGLRHNFAGSFDALNFRSEYWDLRDDGNMAPRHVDPVTEAELNGRIHEFEYSTIMDYPGSRNVGWAGLGHYDHAAVKFGYAGLVEVLTEVPDIEAVPGLPNDIALSYIGAYNSSNVYPTVLLWYTNGSMLELHYTDYPAIAGDLEARTDVPLSHLNTTLTEDGAFGDGLVVTEDGGGLVAGMPAVPYRFCSDEFATGITCARFDRGADPYEANTFLMDQYFNDYILRNFARERYGYGNAARYVGRMQSRTFEPIRTWQRYYTLFHGLFDATDDPFAQEYFAADKGFGGWTAATDESFRFLVQVVTRPEPGLHDDIVRPDGTAVLAPDAFAGTVDVPLGTGAYYESEWDFESGYHWFDRQTRIGSYWDRMLALMALTNTASYGFIGYDTSIDPRAYALGYQDLYRDPLALVLGELMADEVDRLGPAMMSDGTLRYPDPLAPEAAWPPAGSDLVQPAAYWLVQFDAGLFGKALLSHGYDRSFINRSRMYVEGSGDAVLPSPDQDTVSFVDPYSGKTWTAWSFPAEDELGDRLRDSDGAPIELGSSARMVRKAQRLDERCATEEAACAELQRLTADMDLQLQLFNEFESTTD